MSSIPCQLQWSLMTSPHCMDEVKQYGYAWFVRLHACGCINALLTHEDSLGTLH